MSVNSPISRRSVLAVGLAGAGAAALAACGSSSGSPAANKAGGDGSSTKSGEQVMPLNKVQVGSSASATIDDQPVLVFRDSQDSVVCFSAICTHEGCTVNPDGAKFSCPCHGSMYDAKTGKVLRGPAPRPLPKVPVRVQGGEIISA